MFERKNQKFEHYNKLLDHDGVVSDDGSEDFITLKRENHGLSDSEGHREENLSKRKLKMSKSKRAKLKSTEHGKKLVFDMGCWCGCLKSCSALIPAWIRSILRYSATIQLRSGMNGSRSR